MRTLYHFTTSPFSRRTRLALAHKGIDVELREARQNPFFQDEAKKLSPLRTVPVFVEEDGGVIGDSSAIARYLDAAYPDRPALFPRERTAARATAEIMALVDGSLNPIIDMGSRYYALHGGDGWKQVTTELLGRAQGALDTLGARASTVGAGTLTSAGWCVADMWLYTMITWLAGLPARANTSSNIQQILSLSWTLPTSLTHWGEAQRARPEVRILRE